MSWPFTTLLRGSEHLKIEPWLAGDQFMVKRWFGNLFTLSSQYLNDVQII